MTVPARELHDCRRKVRMSFDSGGAGGVTADDTGRSTRGLSGSEKRGAVSDDLLHLGQRLKIPPHIGRMETERSGTAFESDPSLAVDDIQPVRPTRIRPLRCVVERIQQRRNLNIQLAHTGIGDAGALVKILRARKYDPLPLIRVHLPDVGGMGFQNVHNMERDAILIVLVKLIKRGNLPAKWR